MKKCSQAASGDSECKKDSCCYYCEDRQTCDICCTRFDDKADMEESGCEDQFDEETALQKFEKNEKSAAIMQQIATISRQKKELEQKEKEVRASLEAVMNQYGIKSFENDILKVVYVAPSTKTTVDSKKLKADFPEAYEKCSKTSNVKESVRITVK